MTREQFLAENRLEDVLSARGIKVVLGRVQQDVKCPLHEDGTASFSINTVKQVWHCKAGCGGGSVIDLIAKIQGIDPATVLKQNGVNGNGNGHAAPPPKEPEWKTVCTYDYTDERGELLYQVVRQHADAPDRPKGYIKTFKQRQPGPAGAWKWTMDGAMRVLYRLPKILVAEQVWIVEGEKDADNLVKLGIEATTNVGGAGKWLDAYSDYLTGKQVVVCGDNDEPGRKHAKAVFDSLAGKAATVKAISVPAPCKDVTDYIDTFKTSEESRRALDLIAECAMPFTKGIQLPIVQLHEIEARYSRMVNESSTMAVNLGQWIPTLGKQTRPLMPGEVAVIIADTGTGKTAVLQNIALAIRPQPILMFELELPDELLFERFLAANSKLRCEDVEAGYRSGDRFGRQALSVKFGHIFLCTQSRLSLADMEKYIMHAELKIGRKPVAVLIDYIGLLNHGSGSRYERMSDAAERLKVIAKTTQTVLICASQIRRPVDDESEPSLHDCKDSGSIENSAGLVIGLWKDVGDHRTMYLRVLKNTKGRPGHKITCNFDGEKCLITERSPFDEHGLPYQPDPH